MLLHLHLQLIMVYQEVQAEEEVNVVLQVEQETHHQLVHHKEIQEDLFQLLHLLVQQVVVDLLRQEQTHQVQQEEDQVEQDQLIQFQVVQLLIQVVAEVEVIVMKQQLMQELGELEVEEVEVIGMDQLLLQHRQELNVEQLTLEAVEGEEVEDLELVEVVQELEDRVLLL